MVAICISDHGIGVQEHERERIFDKFYRSENAGGVSGTGLGLSICRGIVEAHGGHIRAEERRKGGTSFIFTVPGADPPE